MHPTRRALLGGSLALVAISSVRAATPLRVVASSVPHAEILAFVQDKLARDLPLRVIEISGDIRPNRLLLDGDADANFFQHVPYLRAEEKELGIRFAVTATVHVEPLGIYSRRYKALADVPRGATVALSNNVTNFSRGLKLLQDHGLIRLRPGGDGTFATAGDIADNPKALTFVEVAPPQLPRSLDDVALSVINGNYALEAGLNPAKDALGLERAEGNPYANVLVTTEALAHDPRVERLSALLESAEVGAFIRERYRGSVIPAART
ncbi:MetQ/NlpA family ABC transporter substrate-binding protein [Methylobacterium planeticum]|uniref:Lipoprotein n=1 Tax=Methylobacterium planeticum TaxID=2615211 RepID=A0A6N6MNI0_9HYPH|nr:MetQ/NlpA family ABC transporter substrate-binding protein [Methylobacterium planeticum]KAB1071736.1 ABC transporter substrate-binding protein [Methylobacterium planeticum]